MVVLQIQDAQIYVVTQRSTQGQSAHLINTVLCQIEMPQRFVDTESGTNRFCTFIADTVGRKNQRVKTRCRIIKQGFAQGCNSSVVDRVVRNAQNLQTRVDEQQRRPQPRHRLGQHRPLG